LLSRPKIRRNVERPRLKWLEAAELRAKTKKQNANNGQKCASVIKQNKILGCKGKIIVTK
jgi:hypothetical protein